MSNSRSRNALRAGNVSQLRTGISLCGCRIKGVRNPLDVLAWSFL
jgi:hypothetical protein